MALKPLGGPENKEADEELIFVNKVVHAFCDLREEASSAGDHTAAKGFKLAVNSFIGALSKVTPVVRNRIVQRVCQEMDLACEVIDKDPSLIKVAMVSDSVVFTSADGHPILTDERISQVVKSLEEVSICTFELDKDYANFVIIGGNVQFGLAHDQTPPVILQRGVIQKKLTHPVALEYVNDMMHYVLKVKATNGGGGKQSAVAPRDNKAIEAVKGDDSMKRAFHKSQNMLLRALQRSSNSNKRPRDCAQTEQIDDIVGTVGTVEESGEDDSTRRKRIRETRTQNAEAKTGPRWDWLCNLATAWGI